MLYLLAQRLIVKPCSRSRMVILKNNTGIDLWLIRKYLQGKWKKYYKHKINNFHNSVDLLALVLIFMRANKIVIWFLCLKLIGGGSHILYIVHNIDSETLQQGD
jgi:hypothetical protein